MEDLVSSDLESFLASLAFVRQEVQDGETVYYHMHHWHGEGSGGRGSRADVLAPRSLPRNSSARQPLSSTRMVCAVQAFLHLSRLLHLLHLLHLPHSETWPKL